MLLCRRAATLVEGMPDIPGGFDVVPLITRSERRQERASGSVCVGADILMSRSIRQRMVPINGVHAMMRIAIGTL